jgi:hypothetical protein
MTQHAAENHSPQAAAAPTTESARSHPCVDALYGTRAYHLAEVLIPEGIDKSGRPTRIPTTLGPMTRSHLAEYLRDEYLFATEHRRTAAEVDLLGALKDAVQALRKAKLLCESNHVHSRELEQALIDSQASVAKAEQTFSRSPLQQPDQYLVTWSIDSDAATPLEAARKAWEAVRRGGSMANVFEVRDRSGSTTLIDLDEHGEGTDSSAH